MEKKTPTVNQRQLDWEKMCSDEAVLLLNKGADYTAGRKDADAYANFRIIADLLKGAPITPYTVAMIYGLKHVLSLITFAKTGKQESGEGLRGRHMDARNYYFILNELVPDHAEHFAEEANVDLVNSMLDDVAAESFGPVIAEDLTTGLVEFFDEDYQRWYPISELDKRKEVDNSTTNDSCPGCCCIGQPLVEIADLRGRK
jgi:hypothetical protein